MNWLSRIFRRAPHGILIPEDIVRAYQHDVGFFPGQDPGAIVQEFTRDHGKPPVPGKPWDEVYLLAYDRKNVWSSDPEADVCAENQVYAEIFPEWSRVSGGAFTPAGIKEHWAGETGPVTLEFRLGDRLVTVSPAYLDDWIDLAVLEQINKHIEHSGRQFECIVDGNFALVFCITKNQKTTMRSNRQLPFAW